MKKIIFQHHKQQITFPNPIHYEVINDRGKTWHAQSQFNIPLKHTHTINNSFLVVNYHLFSKKPKSFVSCSKL